MSATPGLSVGELAPPPHPMLRRMQRIDAIEARERQISRLQAQQRLEVAALAREDRGGIAKRFVRDELALAWCRSPRQADNRLVAAEVFAAFPAVVARVEDGTWHLDHADAVLDELVGSGLDHDDQQRVLDLVLSRPGGRTPWELRGKVRTALVVLFPEHAAERARRAATDRDVHTWSAGPGAAGLTAYGPAPAIADISAALDAMTWPPAPGDTRTAAQRRFDTLRDLVCGRATPGSWQVQVLVSLATLEGHDELPAEIPGLGPVPAGEVRRLVAEGATLRRVVVDEHGRLVAVDDTLHRPDLPTPLPTPTASTVPGTAATPSAATPSAATPSAAASATDDCDEDLSEPDPNAPSAADLAWLAEQPLDRAARDLDQHTDTLRDAHLRAARARTPDRRADDMSPETAHPDAAASATAASSRRSSYPTAGGWSGPGLAAALHRMRTDPLVPANLSSPRYAPTRRLRRHLELRDRTCVFPGCPRLAATCDKDHVIPWPRGSTSEANLADECEPHHLAKHNCFTVERLTDGTVRWTSPAGHVYDRPPVPVLDAWAYRGMPGVG